MGNCKGYKGMLMSDGYSAWRTLKKATHFGCMAHARRMFTDVFKGQKNKPSPRAAKALEYFQALYQVEALAKGKLAAIRTVCGSSIVCRC